MASAVGPLIGVERGRKEREARVGECVAGVRTYGLIGLLGGGIALVLVAERLGALPVALAFVALAGVLTTAMWSVLSETRTRASPAWFSAF